MREAWSIPLVLWVGAFGGVMRKMNAFDPIAVLVLRMVHKVRHLMFSNAVICLLGNAALADEMAQVVTIGPIIKDMTESSVVGSKEDMYTLALRMRLFRCNGSLGSGDPMACLYGILPRHQRICISARIKPDGRGYNNTQLFSWIAWVRCCCLPSQGLTDTSRSLSCLRPDVYLKSEAAKYVKWDKYKLHLISAQRTNKNTYLRERLSFRSRSILADIISKGSPCTVLFPDRDNQHS